MNIVEKQNLINNSIEPLMTLYYQATRLQELKVNIELTDRLFERKLALSPTEKEKQDVINNRSFIDGLNGTIVFPLSVNEQPTILIAVDKIDVENFQYISTITHELTHIHDYTEFLNKEGIKYFDELETAENFTYTYHWSEYNATKKGYLFLRTFLVASLPEWSAEEQIQHIKNHELPFQFNHLVEHLNENSNNPTLFLYGIIRFLGRFSVWEDTFPQQFNARSLPAKLLDAYGDKLIRLHDFLRKQKSLNDIYLSFDEFHKLLGAFTTEG